MCSLREIHYYRSPWMFSFLQRDIGCRVRLNSEDGEWYFSTGGEAGICHGCRFGGVSLSRGKGMRSREQG